MKKLLITIILLIIGTPMIKAETINNGDVVIPIGSIQSYGGSNLPEGYLEANGQAISRTTYSKLFEIYKTMYGAGDGSTTFNLPNLNGKVIVGQNDKESEFNTLGKTGGAKRFNNSHTHKVASHTHTIPSHTHTVAAHTHTISSHTHSIPSHTHTIASHTHTTKDHTLIIDEIPSHRHELSNFGYAGEATSTDYRYTVGYGLYGHREIATYPTGGGKAHNHGDTGGSGTLTTAANTTALTTGGSGELKTNGTSLTTAANTSALKTDGSGELTTAASGSSSQSLLQPYIVLKYIVKVK